MAKAKGKSTPARKPVPVWLWLLNLAAASGFVYFLYYLQKVPDAPAPALKAPTQSTAQPKTNTATQNATGEKPTSSAENKPRFEFYEVLPETEVNPAPVEAYAPKKSLHNYDYLIQTGSFRNREDAERQKATIAFQGLRAEIREVTGESGTWYRVQIGPISNRSTMNKAVDRLVAINIQPLVKKVKRESQNGG